MMTTIYVKLLISMSVTDYSLLAILAQSDFNVLMASMLTQSVKWWWHGRYYRDVYFS